MKNLLRIAAFLLAFTGLAHAQSTGQLQSGQTWGNPSAAKALAGPTTVGALIDRSLSCTAQGDIIYRGVSLWTCLAPGTAGLPLVSGGAGANLVYSTLANAALANSAVTVNGTTCTLGSSCSPTAIASSTVVGTTTITGGTTARLLYDNGGVLGEALLRYSAANLFLGDVDAASPVAQTLSPQNVVGGTTDTAGIAWTNIGSKGTGTAASGNLIDKTGFSAKVTGSTQHTTVDRRITVAKGKVLADATPVSLFEVALPTLAMAGGQIEATVVCTDGAEMQSFTQTITYSVVNKGGVYTKSITATTGDKSVTGGSTLANTWSLLDGTNKVTVQLSSDTSLTPSTNAFVVYYTVKNNSEQATTIQ